MSAFAFDMYAALAADGQNLFFSPHSIATALTMTAEGAGGQTATEMASVLDRSGPGYGHCGAQSPGQNDFDLRVANSLWAQQGLAIEEAFFTRMVEQYDSALQLADFMDDPEGARRAINGWVEKQTKGKIQDLLMPGVITILTRLVVANAVYFKAEWQNQLEPARTTPAPFHLTDGTSQEVPMMRGGGMYNYAEGEGYQAIRLGYRGNASMLVIAPTLGHFADIRDRLSTEFVGEVASRLARHQVTLGVPRFKLTTSFDLTDALRGLGMVAAFDPALADFTGVTQDPPPLFISNVIHKAFADVDEYGTEAAAATAVVMQPTGALITPVVELTLDRPFIFAIEHVPSGAILFLGHLLQPT